MQRRLMSILACPIDKSFPLRLIELESKGDIVISGALLCQECARFYPIIDEIPVMLPDELRRRQEDIDFINKWRDKLPKEIVEGDLTGNPS